MELVLLVEVVVREFIVFVSTGGIGTIGRSGSQGIHTNSIVNTMDWYYW